MKLTAHDKTMFGGVVTGVVAMAVAWFTQKRVPTAQEVAGLLGGAGITVASVVSWFVAHTGITKASIAQDVVVAEKVKNDVASLPLVQQRLSALEARVPASAQVDIAAVAAAVKAEILK